MKDIYVLGIHDGHCSTACLLKNGEIISCTSEERYSYNKNESGIPKKAISFCLKNAGITPKNLSLVVLASKFMAPVSGRMYALNKKETSFYSFFYKKIRSFRKILYYTPNLHDKLYSIFGGYFYNKSSNQRTSNLANFLGINKNKILTQEHHSAHAYSVLYSSGFVKKHNKFLVLTLDAEGDGLCSSVNIFQNRELKRIAKTSNAYSLGMLYSRVTDYLGMKSMEHEYKVMGLAPYAEKERAKDCSNIFKKVLWLNNMSFKGSIHSHAYPKFLEKNFKRKRFDWISGGIQNFTEELIIQWVKNCIKTTGINNVLFSGGVFMNVKLNKEILEIENLNDCYFMPSSGDESLAIGSAYFGYKRLCIDRNLICSPKPLKTLYLGDDINEKEIPIYFSNSKKYKIEKPKNPEKKLAQLIAKGNIVARCSGKMEWGARALGNRSILSDPSRQDLVMELNKAIKSRDFWMPFAPVVLDKYKEKYIVSNKKIKAPYMILAFDSTEKAKKDLVAANHPYDQTIRPQVLERNWNPKYYDIISNFEKITKKGSLLNTSFNLHGFPVVKGVKEAFHVMENSSLKYLLLGNYLISKK